MDDAPIPFNPEDLKGPQIPEKPHVTVHLQRGGEQDTVWLSQCVDPTFDMQLIAEGLATAIVINSEYTGVPALKILEEVVHNLAEGIKWHGKIQRHE